jgi:hypothetical protein
VLVAIVALVVIAAVVALMVWATPLTRSSRVGAEDAGPSSGTGSAVVHDDAWNMPRNAGPTVVHDDAGNLHAST